MADDGLRLHRPHPSSAIIHWWRTSLHFDAQKGRAMYYRGYSVRTELASLGDRLRDVGPGRLERVGRLPSRLLRSIGRLSWDATFFDTAWGYGKGHSESILGRVVRDHPDKKLIVATKLPPKNFQWPSRRGFTLDECFPPYHIREYAEKSLANLGLPHIDLLQFHVWEDAWAKDERWQRAMDDLKDQEGLIRAVGISVNRWEPNNGHGGDQDRPDRRRSGDLQYLRPSAARRALCPSATA